jgi:hypothetical protein
LKAGELRISVSELDDLPLAVAELEVTNPVGDGLIVRPAKVYRHDCIYMLADEIGVSIAEHLSA